MSLLSDLLKESASAGSTAGGSIANSQTSLFGGKNGGVMIMRRMGYVPVGETPSKNKRKPFSTFTALREADGEVKAYDYQSTLSKLDQAVKTANEERHDIAVFGVEDDEGKVIKVYVQKDQADDFEDALSAMLADGDDVFVDDIAPKDGQEIAEILFKLKDEFDIVDIEWGTIEGDEEEEDTELDLEGDADDLENLGGDDLEDGDDVEGGDELDDEAVGAEDETVAMSALQAVIQMMQAEAQAKLADAEARKKEAEAAIAQSATQAATAKVKQEEEILAMEEKEKAEKEAKKEAETLAKLAKYRKETDDTSSEVDDVSVPIDSAATITKQEQEEVSPEYSPRVRSLTKEDLAQLIMKYARRQK